MVVVLLVPVKGSVKKKVFSGESLSSSQTREAAEVEEPCEGAKEGFES